MPVEGLNSSHELPVIPATDQHLRTRSLRLSDRALGGFQLAVAQHRCSVWRQSVSVFRPPGSKVRDPACEFVLTLFVKTCRGPFWKSSSSLRSSSSTLGFVVVVAISEIQASTKGLPIPMLGHWRGDSSEPIKPRPARLRETIASTAKRVTGYLEKTRSVHRSQSAFTC